MRHEIEPLSIPGLWQGDCLDFCESHSEEDFQEDQTDDAGFSSTTATVDPLCQSPIGSFNPAAPQFDENETVVELLNFYASLGDVQMCVSALIVLGDLLKSNSISELTQESWYTAYIELLSRFQLWNVANLVRISAEAP